MRPRQDDNPSATLRRRTYDRRRIRSAWTRRGRRRNPMHAVPPALDAPPRAKTPEKAQHAPRLDSQRLRIALRTADAVRQDPEKHDRRRDTTQHEQTAEHECEPCCIRHPSLLRPHGHGTSALPAIPCTTCSCNLTNNEAAHRGRAGSRSRMRLEARLDRCPRFDDRHTILDAIDAHFDADRNRRAIETPRRNRRVPRYQASRKTNEPAARRRNR